MEPTTERLVLRPFTTECAGPFAQLYVEDWPNLAPWSPEREPEFFTAQGQLERLTERLKSAERGEEAPFGVYTKEHATLIGTVEVTDIIRGPFQQGFLGYWVAASAGGRGYATEAADRVAT
ncbi:MAG: GNAT family N-acetyltransferase [Spirochaeta sp.]|jgi:ribosomal-protein-alanine N-acetyltransferase|nr:GNAT family N-acetyltransferase [Spirochaeta sp.]